MDSVLNTVRNKSESFRSSVSEQSSRTVRFAKDHAKLVVGAGALTAVASAGLAAGLSGGPAAAGTGGQNALNQAGVHSSQVQTIQAHANGTRGKGVEAAGSSTIVRGTHHQFAHAQMGNGGPAGHVAAIRHRAPAKPYLIYDSTTPSALPAQHVAAAYATGSYAASRAQLAGHKQVVWIDTTGHDPSAMALDVEPGDATPQMAASWAQSRLSQHPNSLAVIYTMRSEWPAAKAAIGTLPQQMQNRVRWWIADPTGVPHIVPGASATQWYWGSSYDISTATHRF